MSKIVNQHLKDELDRIVADGFNIYALIVKAKRSLKNKDIFFPDEVLLKVCDQYWFQRTQIRNRFPWFLKVLREEWMRYNAANNIRESQKYKYTIGPRGGVDSVESILSDLIKKLDNGNLSV